MTSYTLNRKPTRETYQQILDDILRDGYSFIRKSLLNKVKGWVRRDGLRWSFRADGGRLKVTPRKE